MGISSRFLNPARLCCWGWVVSPSQPASPAHTIDRPIGIAVAPLPDTCSSRGVGHFLTVASLPLRPPGRTPSWGRHTLGQRIPWTTRPTVKSASLRTPARRRQWSSVAAPRSRAGRQCRRSESTSPFATIVVATLLSVTKVRAHTRRSDHDQPSPRKRDNARCYPAH